MSPGLTVIHCGASGQCQLLLLQPPIHGARAEQPWPAFLRIGVLQFTFEIGLSLIFLISCLCDLLKTAKSPKETDGLFIYSRMSEVGRGGLMDMGVGRTVGLGGRSCSPGLLLAT